MCLDVVSSNACKLCEWIHFDVTHMLVHLYSSVLHKYSVQCTCACTVYLLRGHYSLYLLFKPCNSVSHSQVFCSVGVHTVYGVSVCACVCVFVCVCVCVCACVCVRVCVVHAFFRTLSFNHSRNSSSN